jgi:hypothetical protein
MAIDGFRRARDLLTQFDMNAMVVVMVVVGW